MLIRILNYLFKVIISPIFIAVLVGYASYIGYFGNAFNKYEWQIIDEKNTSHIKHYFVDLDNDNLSELVILNHDIESEKRSYIMIYQDELYNHITHSQTNMNNYYVKRANLIIEDVDCDGIKEIFVFLLKDSSVYLQGFKYNSKINIGLTEYVPLRKISRVNLKGNNFEDFVIANSNAIDVNNDGVKELVFHINGAYSATPRKFFVYDIKNDKLFSSPDYHISVQAINVSKSQFSGKSYFLPTSISTPMNVGDSSILHHDRSSWIFAFNDSLKPLFEPIQLGYGFANANIQLFFTNDTIEGILALYISPNKNILTLYSYNGDTLYQKELEFKEIGMFPSPDIDKYACTFVSGQRIYYMNYNFEIILKKELKEYDGRISDFQQLDIDNDNKKEYFFLNNYGKTIQLYDDDFSEMFSIPNNDLGFFVFVQSIKTQNKENHIFIYGNKRGIIVKYSKNNLYFLSYVIPFFIIVVFYFLIYLALKQREKVVEHRNKQEKLLIESQLKIANKQMSPHFQLNVLNSISYLFDEDKDKAQYYLGKYSRLVSQIMMNVDKIETTLENEIQFTSNYLVLEQLRLDNKFDFEINIDSTINQNILIPRMSVFTFCENAIKHGLFHLKDKGSLSVNIKKINEKEILISVDDNGIGRKESKKINTSGTGMGIKTLTDIFEHFQRYRNTKIKFEIIDKIESQGVRVEITLNNPVL